jgi:hypothetical protein
VQHTLGRNVRQTLSRLSDDVGQATRAQRTPSGGAESVEAAKDRRASVRE